MTYFLLELLMALSVVIAVVSTSNHFGFGQPTRSNLANVQILRSTLSEALTEPLFQPRWDILNYRGGHITPLEVDGRPGFVIEPLTKADKQRRWIWIAPSWLAIGRWDTGLQKIVDSPKVDHLFYIERVLAEGFHVAGVDIGVSCGNPAGVAVFRDFYEMLLNKYHLNPRARMVGQSNGGLMVYSYAAAYPDSVDRILGIYPATDLRSWPGLPQATGRTEKTGWNTPRAYDMPVAELEARIAEFNPIDRLAPLANHKIGILHLHGDQDATVPIGPNSQELARRYRAFGGNIEIVVIRGKGHGPDPAFYESMRALRFLLE